VIAALTGIFLSTEYTSQTNWLMDLSDKRKRQTFLALTGFLLTPAGVLAPLAGGFIMDIVGFKTVAVVVGVCIAAAMTLEYRAVPLRAAP
jgi:MFS family permease